MVDSLGPRIVGEIDGGGQGVGTVGDEGHHLIILEEEGVNVLHLAFHH